MFDATQIHTTFNPQKTEGSSFNVFISQHFQILNLFSHGVKPAVSQATKRNPQAFKVHFDAQESRGIERLRSLRLGVTDEVHRFDGPKAVGSVPWRSPPSFSSLRPQVFQRRGTAMKMLGHEGRVMPHMTHMYS